MEIGHFRLGMRTIKTALAVMICILLFKLLDRGTPLIAAVSAVFSLRQDLTSSVSFGKSRIIGNSLGGLLALIFILVQASFSHSFLVEALFLPFLVIIIIVLSDGLNNNSGIVSAIATLLLIALSIPHGESIYYVFERVIDTFIGTFVGIGLNVFIRPKAIETRHAIDEDLVELEKKEKELAELRIKVQEKIEKEQLNK